MVHNVNTAREARTTARSEGLRRSTRAYQTVTSIDGCVVTEISIGGVAFRFANRRQAGAFQTWWNGRR